MILKVEIKPRKVVQFIDMSSPVVITIMEACGMGVKNQTMYHYIYEEPDSCIIETLPVYDIEFRFGLTEYSHRIFRLLEEIENESIL